MQYQFYQAFYVYLIFSSRRGIYIVFQSSVRTLIICFSMTDLYNKILFTLKVGITCSIFIRSINFDFVYRVAVYNQEVLSSNVTLLL